MNHPDAAFDIDCIPFSYRGSWLNLSPIVGRHRRSAELHLVSHRTELTAVLELVPTQDARPAPAERHARRRLRKGSKGGRGGNGGNRYT